jgi:type 2 lantibiotic biosynthesis protein LanM
MSEIAPQDVVATDAIFEQAGWLRALSAEQRDVATSAPSWLTELREAYAEVYPQAISDETSAKDPETRFLNLVGPLLSRAQERLRRGADRLVVGFEDVLPAEVAKLFEVELPAQLLWMIDRTCVLELNVARLEDRLSGEDPAQRFHDFVESLARRERALALWLEYPVLARAVVECLEAWVEHSLEVLGRLRHDWDEIGRRCFSNEDPGLLVGIETGAGDPHRGGRSVALLAFASGATLVYKPRPVSCERHFQDLLLWLNQREVTPDLRTFEVIDRGDYGWVEFVASAPCERREGLLAYHRRLGSLLAVLHAVGAVDCHFQNLIAAGDQPVAVDLESLFHPSMPLAESAPADERLAAEAIGESVLRVGLLPFRVGDAAGGRPDWSGVASVAGQSAPDQALGWEGSGTDEMRAARKLFTAQGGKNRPSFEGQEADVADYIDPLIGGFEETSRRLAGCGEELLADGGPIAAFAQDPVRVVVRATRAYGLLLENGWHPDLLRDALDRERFFARVGVGADAMPVWRHTALHERRDLSAGDIPYFQTRPDSCDLWTSRGERLEGVFPESSLAKVRRRLKRWSEDEIRRQAWLARVSLATLLLNRRLGDWEEYELIDPGAPAGDALRRELIEQALALGRWFERMAARDGDDATWITLDLRQGVWALFPSSEDLYAGIPGIALFLGYLSAISGRSDLAETARLAMNTLLRRLKQGEAAVRYIGLYQGWGGVLYAIAHLGVLWNDSRMLEEGEKLVEIIASKVAEDNDLDAVVGSAGAVMALLAFHRACGSERAREVALACGEHLVARALPVGPGCAWRTAIGGEDLPTGYAHGAAGIASALVELARATGDERFTRTALSALDYERQALWPELHRWLEEDRASAFEQRPADLPADRSIALSWCYGAPGIGLSRVRALAAGLAHEEHVAESLREEVEHAVRLTLDRGFGKNHCLCHGDLGNLDFLLEARALTEDRLLEEKIASLTRCILHDLRQGRWRCGTVAAIEAPGLMNGLAGIGLGLLRLADPARVPSVLAGDPPVR